MSASRTTSMRLISLICASGVAGHGLAQAQERAGARTLDEIVVTARKREETVQDAPLSIQAFTGEQVEIRGIQNMADLTKYTPGLNVNIGTSRTSSSFSIRGMNQVSPVGDNRRDLVTVFLDGVPLVGSPTTYGVEDLERVEVVKGPQSALFGRATFGGAISMITTTPGNEFKARVSGTAATHGDYRGSLSVEGPIVEDILAARLVVQANTFDGFYKNSLGGRLGETDGLYYAGTLSFTPTDNFSMRVRFSDRSDKDGPEATPLIARFDEHNCGPFPGFLPRPLAGLPDGFTLEQARRSYCGPLRAPSGDVGINVDLPANINPGVPFTDSRLKLGHQLLSGSAEYAFATGHTLTAVASTQDYEIRRLADFERAPEDRYWAYTRIAQEQDSYELRLSSPLDSAFTYMVGVARLEQTYDTIGAFIQGALFGAGQGGPANPASLIPARNASKTDSVFAQVGYDFTDQLNLSVEARRQKDTITSGIGLPTEFDIDTTATLPRFLLRYELTDQTNLYANYAKGNQPTQGYATFFLLTPEQQEIALAGGVTPFAPEAKVENYEIGIKHRSADGRWFANAAIYYLEWVDRQGVRTIQVDLNQDGIIQPGAAPVGETFNAVPFSAGDSNTRGIELDGAYSLTDRLTVGGSAAYAKTNITKALNETLPLRFFGITDAKGFEFGQVPKFSGAAYADYEVPMMGDRSWFIRGDVTYRGRMWDSIANLAYVPSQTRANLRGGIRADNWDVTVFINNLFDDKTLESARYQSDSATDPFFFQLAASEATLANKRQAGITATYRF
ncbi:MAG: TonB-dependent receptor [Gammaproteobacteria bacterium]|nr:TonB-dependent receptor [Gammaproteobacteria bacterium]